ncbi:MAG TPA: hypothetical protein VGX69_11545 [Solirubrobacteraceae bacterium]|jgi:hypothetical protein|nr:hypothetical protein [Solirubrobacteraceae bacterium]
MAARRPAHRRRCPPRRRRPRAIPPALFAGAAAIAIALGGCGNTLQDQPIPHNELETMVVAPYPVYWLGRSFRGLQITEALHDPSGAYGVQYGDCVEGGQNTCVTPVRVVTSPDNGFVAGGSTPRRTALIRGVPAVVAQHGATIEIPTAGVVVGIYAESATLARAAAQTLVPINEVGAPGGTLPARLPDTGYGSTPLPTQEPPPLRVLG